MDENPCHNHQEKSHFASSFTNIAELREQDILTDITLVSDDKCQIRAHKLVLMASSEYFRIMFKSCYAEADLDSLAMPGKFLNPSSLFNTFRKLTQFYSKIKIWLSSVHSILCSNALLLYPF